MKRPHAAVLAAGSVLLGLVLAAVGWRVWLKPQQDFLRMRHETMLDVATLYGLQLRYRRTHPTFAGDLDSLIAGAPGRDALKARLAANVDLSTIALDGDAAKFKIEVNVRDPERTLIKVKGPLTPRRGAAAPAGLPAPAPPQNADGAPIAPARYENTDTMGLFKLHSPFKPAGDQPDAIDGLVRRLKEGAPAQTLLGVTGSGKTFAIANVIQQLERPTLVMSPNKVLAAQLYAEFKAFFPENAVEFFISYYDYYQPEAYVPSTDTFIEKDSSINDRIDRLRLKATSSLMARRDVIVVASVSCIYNIGSPEQYEKRAIPLEVGWKVGRDELAERLVAVHYERNEMEFVRGKFRMKGGVVDIFPAYMETALRVTLGDDSVAALMEFDPLTGKKIKDLTREWVYPAKHFVTGGPERARAVAAIEAELAERIKYFKSHGKLIEAQRIEQRTHYDLEMLREIGFCHGIENYSRPLSGRAPGERPNCLIDFFPKDYVLVVDESHVAVPQIGGMYQGDRARKQTLVDFGWRLPSALDNRPLKFAEFEALAGQTVFVSATPGPYELTKTQGEVVEMVVRPTGLVDPETIIRPSEGQLDDLLIRLKDRAKKKERALITTLTKRTAEDLTSWLLTQNVRARYLHSDIDSLERIQILQDLRAGVFDVLVGINLLREGLDLPEVSLVAILGADHEGFLRSETTLIQISGRAARNVGGQVILYADTVTGSMKRALDEMDRRRTKQVAYNLEHGIKPKTIIKAVEELEEFQTTAKREGLMLLRDAERPLTAKDLPTIIEEVEKRMRAAADALDFEQAALLRDQLYELKSMSASRDSKTKRARRPRSK